MQNNRPNSPPPTVHSTSSSSSPFCLSSSHPLLLRWPPIMSFLHLPYPIETLSPFAPPPSPLSTVSAKLTSNDTVSISNSVHDSVPSEAATSTSTDCNGAILNSSQTSSPIHQSDESQFVDRIGESARNRFGRPYISGRPLLLCDRQKIIKMHREGCRKIQIARSIGVTHSCVSKVIRRFEETGMLDSKNSRTASCACPGDAKIHDLRICRHAKFKNQLAHSSEVEAKAQKIKANLPVEKSPKNDGKVWARKFSIEWLLSDH